MKNSILNKITHAVAIISVASIMITTGCAKAPVQKNRYSSQFLDVFDTISMEIGYEADEDTFKKRYEDSHTLLLKEHQLFDIYNDYEGMNNLKTVNDNAGKQPVKVDKELIDLIKWGKEVYTLTDGKLNIAYGAVLKLWHDKREIGMNDPSKGELPDENALKEAAKHTNIDDVIIDEEAGTIFLKDPEMSLDVGGIGKGYATEDAAKLIESAGSDSFMLNMGGNLRAIGLKNNTEKWVCPVENPTFRDNQTGDQYSVITYLDNVSLVTSGDYERYYVVDGKRYHHIIDPDTLYPATYHRSVTILTHDSALADALSTALFCMSIEDGKKLVKSISEGTSSLGKSERVGRIEVMWIDADGTQTYTDGFADFTKE
ncbi:FAD:protein FMN transferase [Oribacterium sp. WCC10]|uniref:FAD:protein FMN transferase n=1 Tax=Oribacterium sp. WCC10 TaxID=1855343 RepID=UPI0008F2DC45|nr:FAD:protein FMN transferase [Oribacterium sp. WCC10]SFG48131.1 thiamine biosynthesis lipoprotein [Oribacterium sp. WCC10]